MIDEFTCESLNDIIERSVNADALATALSAVFTRCGAPKLLRIDKRGQRTHFQALTTLVRGAYRHGFHWGGNTMEQRIRRIIQQPPTKGMLEAHAFAHLTPARQTITEFHRDDNLHHRHSALGYLTPTQSRRTMENNPNTLITPGTKNGYRPLMVFYE